MNFKKGQKVLIEVQKSRRKAVVAEDGIDNKGRVRVRPEGFPLDMSIKKEEILCLM